MYSSSMSLLHAKGLDNCESLTVLLLMYYKVPWHNLLCQLLVLDEVCFGRSVIAGFVTLTSEVKEKEKVFMYVYSVHF